MVKIVEIDEIITLEKQLDEDVGADHRDEEVQC
jgi:hypothetical protein